jgi:hypothetical protein
VDTLKELIEERGLNNHALAAKAKVSFRALAEIRSGEWDHAMKGGANRWSLKKKRAAIQVMGRIVTACDEEPEEWAKKYNLPFEWSEVRSLLIAARTPKVVMNRKLGVNEWNALVAIADEPLTKQDVLHLARSQEELDDLLTLELVVKLLIKRHKAD